MGHTRRHKGLDVVHYCHRAVFITHTHTRSHTKLMRAAVCKRDCVHSAGVYLCLELIVVQVCRSSVSHHWLSRAINQESPLCLTKSQWAASITEPALPTHEYSPNETASYSNIGLEVSGKNGCAVARMLLRLFLSLPQWRSRPTGMLINVPLLSFCM